MTSVAYLVDGDLEKIFISESCKGSPIRKIGNGDRFPVRVIAKHVMTQVRLLANRYEHIVLLMDLEDRELTPKEFAAEIRAELVAAGIGSQNIIIIIKEREVEDWILSDPDSITEYLGTAVDTSGLTGKGSLARLLRKHDVKYSETTIGVELLKNVYCSRAVARSPSLSYMMSKFPMPCWWLAR